MDITDIIDTTKVYLDDEDIQRSYSARLNITEWDNDMILIEGHIYLFKLFLYDKHKHLIMLGENTKFKHDLLAQHFKIRRENVIGSEIIVEAL